MSEEKSVLLRISNLKQYFPVGNAPLGKPRSYVKANDGISLDIYKGETFGLVGESGCGKSTFGRAILQLYRQTEGRILYYGAAQKERDLNYVEKIYKNLPRKKKQCEELRSKAKKKREAYEKMPEGNKKKAAEKKLEKLESRAENCLLDITALIGGNYTDPSLKELGRIYYEEYRTKKKIRRQKERTGETGTAGKSENRIAAQKKRIAGPGKKADIEELEKKAKIEELEKKAEREAGKIAECRERNRKNPGFDLYESQKDEGINLASLTNREMRSLRKDMQLIFQDPYASLDPRMTVGQIIGEGLRAHGIFKKKDPGLQDYIVEVMEKCGLAGYAIHSYPHQFSGGQRQRIGIARALAVNPGFVVCDEAVSALDVSIQSQIINLLLDLKEQNHLTYLFISHDLSVVKLVSDRIGVMYLGTIVELCETEELFRHPCHPYTEALLGAIPTTDAADKKRSVVLKGDIPSPVHPPRGCKFHTRCGYCTKICKEETPELKETAPGHFAACHHKL